MIFNHQIQVCPSEGFVGVNKGQWSLISFRDFCWIDSSLSFLSFDLSL